jgi:hypothetical protein
LDLLDFELDLLDRLRFKCAALAVSTDDMDTDELSPPQSRPPACRNPASPRLAGRKPCAMISPASTKLMTWGPDGGLDLQSKRIHL